MTPAGSPSPLDAALVRSIPGDALAAWLGARRWFGAKGGGLRRATVHDAVSVGDGDGAFAVARIEVELDDGRVERYQVPLARAARAGADTLPLPDGTHVADAVADPAFGALLARGLERGASYAGDAMRWELRPLDPAGVRGLGDEPVTAMGGEQSNTSLRIGDRAILKLYRKLEAGDHPDVEIAHFLTTRTSFRNTPELLGTVRFEDVHAAGTAGVATVAGMAQRLVPGARDAWGVALDAVRARLAGPDDAADPFARRARELGRTTRALHDALASSTDVPHFIPKTATLEDVQAWADRTRDTIHTSTDLLQRARAEGRLRDRDVAVADAVLRRKSELLADLDRLADDIGHHPGARIRHHGDYHLGQVLVAGDGQFMIIDFEGEPARLLVERREPHSALRDVAGMLRSFAYAAATAAAERGGVGTDPALELRASRWERGVRDAFVEGYAEAGPASFLPMSAEATRDLVTLFEMEKVFYELAYELNNRPDWVWIPLRGVGRLLGAGRSGPAR